MDDIKATVDTYLAAWNETDADVRAKLVEQAWAPDGRYVDPLLEAQGRQAISDMVAGVHEQYPGQRFRRLSGIDAHHDQVRFAWELAAPGGVVTVAGIDVGELGPDGRLRRITGFFGDLPAEGPA
jgi:SnoaL-like domain